jgi:D-alanine-D-alanine ligase
MPSPRIALTFNLKRRHVGEVGYEDEAEFDSSECVEALAAAVAGVSGGEVPLVEANEDVVESLKRVRPDVVFNIAEGRGKRSREAQVPAICDLLGIEHTGSDATTIAVCHDKDLAKTVARAGGVRVPRGRVCRRPSDAARAHLAFPVIVKPNAEGSSKGISERSVVHSSAELVDLVARLAPAFPAGVLCEEYIVGREFTAGVLADHDGGLRVLGPSEICFESSAGPHPVYSFAIKSGAVPYALGGSTGVVVRGAGYRIESPARLDEQAARRVRTFVGRVFRALALRDVARIDFRLDAAGRPSFIEANPLPGLTPGYSDLTITAEASGISYPDLIAAILAPAIARWRESTGEIEPRSEPAVAPASEPVRKRRRRLADAS